MNGKKSVTINSRKFDNKIHRSWKAELIEQSDSLLLFVGEFEKEVTHSNLGVIRRGTVSYEFYWLDRWYNIFRFHEPDGALRNFYCNINLPPRFAGDVLDYVDLDIDILVWKDFRYEILDADEFAENSEKYNYSQNLKQTVDSNVKELIRLIENRQYPFNLEI
jgi:protein associated with RNAse G/E